MHKHLSEAKNLKNDEYYTLYEDIDKEVSNYKDLLKGKSVYCNCDMPHSNFVKYFKNNFKDLGLKEFTATGFTEKGFGVKTYINQYGEYTEDELIGNGSYKSYECIRILKQSDIVITNPPFSLFRNYISLLLKEKKDFLIIGNKNAITYKEVFPYIKSGIIKLGYNGWKDLDFLLIDGSYTKVSSVWYTSLEVFYEIPFLDLVCEYSEDKYPKYDEYNAININKTTEIPKDYSGLMGVPISFLSKYNPKQFEIVDCVGRYSALTGVTPETQGRYLTMINGNPTFERLIIKKRL